jgi:hypothetical protein
VDNSPDNLTPMPAGEHARLHRTLPPDRWSMRHAACIICGSTERPHQSRGRCDRCSQRERLGCRPQIGRWSLDFDHCISCQTTDRKHAVRGLCKRCYSREWQRANAHRAATT